MVAETKSITLADKLKQHSLNGNAHLTGIALHTGHRVGITMRPAPVNSGIIFRRTDLPGEPQVTASIHNVVDTQRGTTISENNASVHTVEHLLAAFNACDIDNAIVDMTGPEPPVGDGSSVPFLKMISQTGIAAQDAERQFLTLPEMLFFERGETMVVAVPSDTFRISCTVKYNATRLDCQYLSLEVTRANFDDELAAARTFCLYEEIEALIKANLICGGSLDNAVVIKGNTILSKEGLRYPDEFVRHKMLDIVGDLYLLGHRLLAHIIAVKPGHMSNVEIARTISQKADLVTVTNAA